MTTPFVKEFLSHKDLKPIAVGGVVNYTPHTINPIGCEPIPPSGWVVRVECSEAAIGYCQYGKIYRPYMGGVYHENTATGEKRTGVPMEVAGELCIVSAMAKEAIAGQFPEREDFVSPGELIRDEQGDPIGCDGFRI